MNKLSSRKRTKKSQLAFLAGAMFWLAGAVEFIAARMHGGHPESLAMGWLFISLGSLWIAIGAKFIKEKV
jgi:hypothetical protein